MASEKQTKSERTRQRILKAAAKVVSKYGYAKASVARITMEAGIASGGYYYYFKTRNELFDDLLPMIGEEMLAFIGDRLKNGGWGIDRETRAFEAYLLFLRERPEFCRVFSEAYVYARCAYNKYFAAAIENYVRALQIQETKGYLNVSGDDCALLAHFLTGVRNYVAQLHIERGGEVSEDIGPAVELYRKLLMGNTFRTEPARKAPRRALASGDHAT
jgi:AcrR family transcriptional regulator